MAIHSEIKSITPKALKVLWILRYTSRHNTIRAKALAEKIWAEELAECHGSRKRMGYARAAGAFCSKLEKQGLVMHMMTATNSGYFITPKGIECLKSHSSAI